MQVNVNTLETFIVPTDIDPELKPWIAHSSEHISKMVKFGTMNTSPTKSEASILEQILQPTSATVDIVLFAEYVKTNLKFNNFFYKTIIPCFVPTFACVCVCV